jgi:hypothetical protein
VAPKLDGQHGKLGQIAKQKAECQRVGRAGGEGKQVVELAMPAVLMAMTGWSRSSVPSSTKLITSVAVNTLLIEPI